MIRSVARKALLGTVAITFVAAGLFTAFAVSSVLPHSGADSAYAQTITIQK